MGSGRVTATLAALALLSFVLGSVHAFSVLVEPLTKRFGASTASVSAIYSLALVSITAMVTLGHRFYGRTSAAALVATLVLVATTGVLIAGHAGSLALLWLGYGVLFGTANGAGYGYALQLSAQVTPGREGLAMGAITAAYALGATLFPIAFDHALQRGDFTTAMHTLAIAIGGCGVPVVLMLAWSGARFRTTGARAGQKMVRRPEILLLWLAYGAAVLSGLMTIGHAVGIARAQGLAPALLVTAPMVIAICNMAGSLAGGWLADRIGARWLLTGLPLLSAAALVLLALKIEPSVLAMLGIIGLVYGAVISVYPAVIARRFGVAAGVPIYGKVFTAWAAAGICGPILAGALFDVSGSFAVALMIGAFLSLSSSAIALRMTS